MRMKKLISLLAALTVVTACSVSAMAADNIIYEGSDATYTINAVAKGTQKTILAVKNDTDLSNGVNVGSIQYIDQGTADSFTFALKEALVDATDVVTVYGGSDETDTPEVLANIGGSKLIADDIALSFKNNEGTDTTIGEVKKLVVFSKAESNVDAEGYGIVYNNQKLPGGVALTTGDYWSVVVAGADVTDTGVYAYVGTTKDNNATIGIVE